LSSDQLAYISREKKFRVARRSLSTQLDHHRARKLRTSEKKTSWKTLLHIESVSSTNFVHYLIVSKIEPHLESFRKDQTASNKSPYSKPRFQKRIHADYSVHCHNIPAT
jgi:hypothetical protein